MMDPHPWRADELWTRRRNLEGVVTRYVVRKNGGTRATGEVDRREEKSRYRRELVFVSRYASFRLLFPLFSSLWECL